MNFETGRRLLLLLQETQGRAYTPFAAESHEQRAPIFAPASMRVFSLRK
jgi:hypothetical protein